MPPQMSIAALKRQLAAQEKRLAKLRQQRQSLAKKLQGIDAQIAALDGVEPVHQLLHDTGFSNTWRAPQYAGQVGGLENLQTLKHLAWFHVCFPPLESIALFLGYLFLHKVCIAISILQHELL